MQHCYVIPWSNFWFLTRAIFFQLVCNYSDFNFIYFYFNIILEEIYAFTSGITNMYWIFNYLIFFFVSSFKQVETHKRKSMQTSTEQWSEAVIIPLKPIIDIDKLKIFQVQILTQNILALLKYNYLNFLYNLWGLVKENEDFL